MSRKLRRDLLVFFILAVVFMLVTGTCRTMSYDGAVRADDGSVLKLPEDKMRELDLAALENERERVEHDYKAKLAFLDEEGAEYERKEGERKRQLAAYRKELEGLKAREAAGLEADYKRRSDEVRASRQADVERLVSELNESNDEVLKHIKDGVARDRYRVVMNEEEVELRKRRAAATESEVAELKAVLFEKQVALDAEYERKLNEFKAKQTDLSGELERVKKIKEDLRLGHEAAIKDIDEREEAIKNFRAVPVEEAMIEVSPAVLVIEKPGAVNPVKSVGAQVIEAKREKGIKSVQAAANEGTERPGESSFAASVYDYNENKVYEVYTQPLRTTDIFLEAGETIVENPFISDSDRWIIGAGVSYDSGRQTIQHVYIKPKENNISASMVINTDRRVYHLLLRSFADVYMPMVKWRYVFTNFPYNIVRPAADGSEGQYRFGPAASITQDISYVDPRYLSFNYKVTYGLFSKPKWLPRLVYDDGKKTYIVFSDIVLQTEMPAIFEGKNEITNYRVNGDLVVIDKLIEKVTIRYKGEKATIEKKKG